jgi:hypothetical protein
VDPLFSFQLLPLTVFRFFCPTTADPGSLAEIRMVRLRCPVHRLLYPFHPSIHPKQGLERLWHHPLRLLRFGHHHHEHFPPTNQLRFLSVGNQSPGETLALVSKNLNFWDRTV